MKKNFILIIFLFGVLLSFSLTGMVSGEEGTVQEEAGSVPEAAEEAEQEAKPAEAVEQRELTREEIISRIKTNFTYHPDIMATIPGLAAKEDESGAYYEYNGTRLEELDRETLFGILRTSNQQISMQSFERTQRQLRQLKQLRDMERTQRMLRQQRRRSIPTTPKTYTPPKIPKTYKPPTPQRRY